MSNSSSSGIPRKQGKDPYKNIKLDHSDISHDNQQSSLRVNFPKNYFGLPIYSLQQNPSALVYQCRKPLADTATFSRDRSNTVAIERNDVASRMRHDIVQAKSSDENYVAQRKVAHALLTMAKNEMMAVHFLHKGGLDAVIKLTGESKDLEVLTTCAKCLSEISANVDNGPVLVEENVTYSLQTLQDVHDEGIKHIVCCVLANLSRCEGLEDRLAMNSALSLLQSLLAHIHHRMDSISFLLMSLSNICMAFSGQDAEVALRLCIQTAKRLESARYPNKALFLADVLVNFSRVPTYASLLCDEGALPMLLHLIDTQARRNEETLHKATEALANLSNNRKNRREIASSGIASRLTLIFEHGSTASVSSILLVMGNLLSSGMFHDKVAHDVTIANILDNLLDINQPKQFTAVAYCICQLSKVTTSCEVMIRCSVVPIILGYLRQAPQHSLDYLWTLLVNISGYNEFRHSLFSEIQPLVNELYEEVRFDSSTVHQQQAVVQVSLNLSRSEELATFMDDALVQRFVQTLKSVFSSSFVTNGIQHAVLAALTNFSLYCSRARPFILGTDLLDAFKEVGIKDDKMNVKYISLLNIISNEETCCYKLLDLGAQSFIVCLQDSFLRLNKSVALSASAEDKRKKSALPRGESSQLLKTLQNDNAADDEKNAESNVKALLSREGEEGLDLSAATLHNLALKRATLSSGVLLTLLSLSKNTKELRVLHCTRALAHMSTHQKSRISLSKEARKIVPLLTVLMRCGCEEAEKVQHYSAIVICNLFSMRLDVAVLRELLKTGAVVDLVVVTLLRVNSHVTKESLGKAFFNLMAVPEIRPKLVLNVDLLASIMELTKVEYIHLLELCVRILFNVSCEMMLGSELEDNFAQKLIALKVPYFVISKLNYAPDMPGSLSSKHIRLLLGMSIANLSFNPSIIAELTKYFATNSVKAQASNEANGANSGNDGSIVESTSSQSQSQSQASNKSFTIAQALNRVFVLESEEAHYCAVVTLFNLSKIPECRVLASDAKTVQLLVDVLVSEGSSIICIKLAVASLCNFSTMSEFDGMLVDASVKSSLVRVLSAPQLHVSVKIDALQTVYNLVTKSSAARTLFIESDGTTAIWKLLKVQGVGGQNKTKDVDKDGTATPKNLKASSVDCMDASLDSQAQSMDEESVLLVISQTVRELCTEVVGNPRVERKLMTDGVMNIVLKLSKIEVPTIKLDMAVALYELLQGVDIMKVLKFDAVDTLFWLTIHDTLGLHDLIRMHVARCLRIFSLKADESKVLVRQERFFPVFKSLVKSKNEDVLWQTAGVLYNLMHVQANLGFLLEKGLVGYIFEIASSGFESVKHICSASLHMIPENMPNMEDPLVLELVLALLEAQGDKFAQVFEKPNDKLPCTTQLERHHAGCSFRNEWTNFKANWASLTCVVDSMFSAALMAKADESINIDFSVSPLDNSGIGANETHRKIDNVKYADFQVKNKPAHGSVSQEDSTSTTKKYAMDAQFSHSLSLEPSSSIDDSRTMPMHAPTQPESLSYHLTNRNDDVIRSPALTTPKPPSLRQMDLVDTDATRPSLHQHSELDDLEEEGYESDSYADDFSDDEHGKHQHHDDYELDDFEDDAQQHSGRKSSRKPTSSSSTSKLPPAALQYNFPEGGSSTSPRDGRRKSPASSRLSKRGGSSRKTMSTLPLILKPQAKVPANSVELLQKAASSGSSSRPSSVSTSNPLMHAKEEASRRLSAASIVSFNEHGNRTW